jgi:hypothetical protein
MDKNKCGTKFHNWNKHLDFTHRQIDDRSERNENEDAIQDAIRNHQEVNEDGRLWSF